MGAKTFMHIQHAYSVVIANADAAQQAIASGSQPVFLPQVDLGIPDDEVEDITEQVAPKLKSRLLQGRFGQHSTSSSSNEPLVHRQQPDPLGLRMMPRVHGINNTWLMQGKGRGKGRTKKKDVITTGQPLMPYFDVADDPYFIKV